MALVTWSEEYSVEVESLDRQHQKLFEMMNELHEAMKAGQGSRVAPQILNSLLAYTREHFSEEEKLMKRANYPELASHKLEHDKLTEEVAQTASDYEKGRIMLSMKLPDFLRKWLQSHIVARDKRYSNYMQAIGIR